MSDYPMLISNKLHSFRNFYAAKVLKIVDVYKYSYYFCHCNRLRLSLFPGGGLKGNRVRIPDRPRCCELLNIRTIPWPLVL